MKKLYLFALGGNEISPVITDPETGKMVNPDLPAQWRQAWKTCEKLAEFIVGHQENSYILSHGNGPQIGNILLRSEYAGDMIHKLPIDVCGADTQGALGYMLAQLSNSLRVRGLDLKTAEIITQVIVDRDDPAFQDPTKFIGPPMTSEEAKEHQKDQRYLCRYYKLNDQGKEVWRRVVPSPKPREIIEIDIIESCLNSGNIPIAVGGGGIPVIEIEAQKLGNLEQYPCNYDITYQKSADAPPAKIYCGVEGVIDKDLSSSLLATRLMERARKRGEDLEVELVILTDVDGVKLNYQQPDQEDVRKLSLSEVKRLQQSGIFPSGSMGPKIEAVIAFLESGGHKAYITNIQVLEQTFAGQAGTQFLLN